MNKLTIPALLLGVVMIAGAFAFMPVQEASTVHTSTATTETQMRIVQISASCTVSSGSDNDTAKCDTLQVNIPTGAAFEIIGMTVEKTGAVTGTSADAFDLDVIVVNGLATTLDAEAAATGDTSNFFLPVGWADLASTRIVGVGTSANDDIRIDDSSGTILDPTEVVSVHLTLLIQGDAVISDAIMSLADTVS